MRTERLKNYVIVAVNARISLNLKPRINNAFLPPFRAFHISEQKYKSGNKGHGHKVRIGVFKG